MLGIGKQREIMSEKVWETLSSCLLGIHNYIYNKLLFGGKPKLFVHLAYGLPLLGNYHKSHSLDVEDLRFHLKESYI